MLHPLEYLQPLRPIGIDEDIVVRRLDQKRGVPDPRDADFPDLELGKNRRLLPLGAGRKDRRDQNLREKISLLPARLWLEADLPRWRITGRRGLCTVRLLRLLNLGIGFSVALKGGRHGSKL